MIEHFDDGNMADVFRIGNVVRKQRGTWWNATRQVLAHLESEGYPWAPRVVAENAETVDLSFISGSTVPASLEGAEDEETLRVIARRAREFHDVVAGFRLTPGTDYVPWPVGPDGETIICHNDLSPWNTVVQNGEFQGFIDWDLVSYGTREWELAWMCWRWAPIYPCNGRSIFTIDEQVSRCRILLETYGLDAINTDGITDLIDRRMECGLEVVEQLGAQGVPGFDRLLATGMHLSGHDDRTWLAQHRNTFKAGLETR